MKFLIVLLIALMSVQVALSQEEVAATEKPEGDDTDSKDSAGSPVLPSNEPQHEDSAIASPGAAAIAETTISSGSSTVSNEILLNITEPEVQTDIAIATTEEDESNGDVVTVPQEEYPYLVQVTFTSSDQNNITSIGVWIGEKTVVTVSRHSKRLEIIWSKVFGKIAGKIYRLLKLREQKRLFKSGNTESEFVFLEMDEPVAGYEKIIFGDSEGEDEDNNEKNCSGLFYENKDDGDKVLKKLSNITTFECPNDQTPVSSDPLNHRCFKTPHNLHRDDRGMVLVCNKRPVSMLSRIGEEYSVFSRIPTKEIESTESTKMPDESGHAPAPAPSPDVKPPVCNEPTTGNSANHNVGCSFISIIISQSVILLQLLI